MLLSQLEYFLALAREEHFGRAAASTYVSPSTLSEAIRKLEGELGVPLVRRGRSYRGLTPEGELVLVWARRMVADHRALSDSIDSARDRLAARARIGVIPSGTDASVRIVAALRDAHPLVTVAISHGMNSEDIVARVRAYELDAGVIHPSAADSPDLSVIPLPPVRAAVVAGPGVFPDDTRTVTGEMLGVVPLGLLEPHMRARHIFDDRMRESGFSVQPSIETDSVEALLALAGAGVCAAVVPQSSVAARSSPALRVYELDSPRVLTPLALVRVADDPMPVLAQAIGAAAEVAGADGRGT